MSRLMRVIATMFAFVLVASACSSDSASKAGGEEPPIVLKIGTNDFPGRLAADQIEEFAARVDELSAGRMRVEPVWRVGGTDSPNWDQLVARQVVSGELEMGNIPSRAFDTVGVTSLRALNAPFLITSDDLLDAVVAGDLADDMLSDLEEIGLVGLALLPEGLRHPFGYDEGLLGPDDYEGGVIRAPASATTAAIFEALGSTVVDDEIDPGSQIGMESAYVFDPLGTGTGNVVLFPKANVLVVNADVFERLNESQKENLEQAASETLTWSIDTRISDAAAAEQWCANGGGMVTADGEVLDALADAVEPVYQQLRTDQLTAELIDRIEEIKTSVTVSEPVVPDGCTGEPADREAAAEGTDDPGVINGSYRFEWDAAELADALVARGAPSAEAADLAKNAGVVSLTFHDGDYDQTWETGFYAGDHCPGTYAISGNRITMVDASDSNDCAGEIGATVVDAVWELTDLGLLLSDFMLSEEPGVTWFTAVHLSKPLVRVD